MGLVTAAIGGAPRNRFRAHVAEPPVTTDHRLDFTVKSCLLQIPAATRAMHSGVSFRGEFTSVENTQASISSDESGVKGLQFVVSRETQRISSKTLPTVIVMHSLGFETRCVRHHCAA